MKKSVPLWVTWTLFAVSFIVFGITKIGLVAIFADIIFLIALFESIRKLVEARKARRIE